MKIIALALSVLQATSAINLAPIPVNSKAGASLINQSRLLENDNNGDGNNDDDGYTWMQGYSVKFIGCHHVAHWNEDADGEDQDEVKIKVERHVRYRLCPTSSCSHNTGLGCTSGYGEYIVDMDTFLQSYLQNKEEIVEEQCEMYYKNNCSCGGDDDAADDDEEMCAYKCYNKAGMSQCIENNPYYDDEQNKDQFDVKDYTYCTEYKGENGEDKDEEDKDRRIRKLEEEEVAYFLGPYCADKGDEILLGLFTDDTCTEFADEEAGHTTYYETFGSVIPYKDETLVGRSCYTCKDTDYYDEDVATRDICPDIYAVSGKCETKISEDSVAYPNENACTYIDGIKIVKHTKKGIIYRQYHGTKKAAIAIALFATSFVLLAFYICFLNKKITVQRKAALAAAASEHAQNNSPRKEKKGFFKTVAKNLSPRSIKKKLSFSRKNSNKQETLI
jgi:hypothetical protein